MNGDTYQRVVAVFQDALARPAAERAAFVHDACADDTGVRKRVLEMLAHDDDSDTGLDRHAGDVAAKILHTAFDADGDWMPEQLDDYTVVRKIGEGGMGSVFEARQRHPERTVALKTLRDGLPSASRVRRFEREIRLLAQLQHPGIARMLDAGVAETGRGRVPYFTMEFVRGRPLLEAARANHLSIRERLLLIAEVCAAVQYAHEQRVIHRDLKPANILIEDGDSAVKILDFGIGRVADDDERPVTAVTGDGQVIGTLPYMSPEQVAGDGRPVGTRTDVYSIGVVLYELLSGSTPLEVGSRAIHEASRIIAEDEPRRLGAIDRSLRGDVETIVAKALEKDPQRRYASASELAADIHRYLEDEPISARPATTLYQVRKFARRHKAVVAGATLASVALVVAAGVSTRWAILADRAAAAETAAKLEARAGEAEMRWLSYRSGITATSALVERDPVEARRQLDAVPAEHRNWEWNYLSAQLGTPLTGVDSTSATWDADGVPIAAVVDTSTIRVFDVRSGRDLQTLTVDRPVLSLTLGPRGGLMSLTYETSPHDEIRHVERGTLVRAVDRGSQRFGIFSPTGEAFTLRSVDGPVIEVVDGRTGRTLTRITAPDPIRRTTFSADGRRLFVCTADQLAAFDTTTGATVTTWRTLAMPPEPGVAHGGTTMALWTPRSAAIRLFDGDGRAELGTLDGHTGGTLTAVYSPSGARLASGGHDDAVRVWDVTTGRHLASLVLYGKARLQFGLDETELILTTGRGGGSVIWQWPSRTPATVLAGHESYVYAVAWAPDGTLVASGSWDRTVRVWDAATGAIVAVLPFDEHHVGGLGFTDDGTQLLAANTNNFEQCLNVIAWDTSTFQRRSEHPKPSRSELLDVFWSRVPGGTAYARFAGGVFATTSDDRRLHATGNNDGTVSLLDPATGEPIRRVRVSEEPMLPRALAISPDGALLAAGMEDGRITLVTLATDTIVATMDDHSPQIYALAFSPDGTRLASGGNDARIRLWDVETADQVAVLTGHEEYVQALQFSPDGTSLLSGSGDGTVRIWRAEESRRRPAAIFARQAPSRHRW